MGLSPHQGFGSDEHRAIEGVAVLLELTPRLPDESDGMLLERMVFWAMQQGPSVRYDAMRQVIAPMILHRGHRSFMELAQVGLDALQAYNRRYGKAEDSSE
jgi:hypothetical protein